MKLESTVSLIEVRADELACKIPLPASCNSLPCAHPCVQRLATRALRAADRESVRDRDDYALVSVFCLKFLMLHQRCLIWLPKASVCSTSVASAMQFSSIPIHLACTAGNLWHGLQRTDANPDGGRG